VKSLPTITEPAAVCRGAALLLVALGAAQSHAVAPNPGVVTRTDVARVGSVVQVRSSIEAPAAVELCYAVLVDFDRLAEFIPGMESSRIVSAPGEPLLLRQVGSATAGLSSFTFDVTLAVTLEPPHRIVFNRVAGNLEQMAGSWQVSGDTAHCVVNYEAVLEPSFWVPPLIGTLLVRHKVEQQVDGLAAEIVRRAVQPAR
jgi:ribosome-associated toxin RatA of RatAB toxin-antitoxin module